jgi:hypothetical protein
MPGKISARNPICGDWLEGPGKVGEAAILHRLDRGGSMSEPAAAPAFVIVDSVFYRFLVPLGESAIADAARTATTARNHELLDAHLHLLIRVHVE